MSEFLYVIQCPKSNLIKIGRTSSTNPYQRISSIQTSNPFKLVVIKIVEVPRGTEHEIHSQFVAYRFNGEWFNPDCLPMLLSVLAKYPEYSRKTFTQNVSKLSVTPVVQSSNFFAFLFRPKYCPVNTYIDQKWQEKANSLGMSVFECFEHTLSTTKCSILFDAYSFPITFEQFQDLTEYHRKVVSALRNPITPFEIFCLEESDPSNQKVLDYHNLLLYFLKLADELDQTFLKITGVVSKSSSHA